MRASIRPTPGSRRNLIGVILAALAAGCAAVPGDHVVLDRARVAVEQARSEPRVRALAASELDLAEVALEQAEAAARAGAPTNHVDHLAYVATRHAALAEAHAEERVARAETRALQQALGPRLADAASELDLAEIAKPPADEWGPAAVPGDDAAAELVIRPSELGFDDAEPSAETDQELGRAVERLRREPERAVSIEADFDLPDPAARTAMERRIELIRGTLLREGIEPSRIVVRASAPREEPATAAPDRPAP